MNGTDAPLALPKFPRVTLNKILVAFILVGGAFVTVLRFTRGLGATTNLSDATPWGFWIGFDVLCGVALAAGGFTLTALVHVLGRTVARSPSLQASAVSSPLA